MFECTTIEAHLDLTAPLKMAHFSSKHLQALTAVETLEDRKREGKLGEDLPLPKPVIILPTIKWAKLKAEHCRIAPTTMMQDPRNIIFLRPRISPMKIVMTAPTKQPTL